MTPEMIKGIIQKPLRDESDYDRALIALEELFGTPPGTEAHDQLGVLIALVESYERRHYPVDLPDPISAMEFHMESNGLSRKDLEDTLNCASGRVSEVLNRKRCLTLGMIRKLHERWGISAEVLIREYALNKDEDYARVVTVEASNTRGSMTYRTVDNSPAKFASSSKMVAPLEPVGAR